MARSDAPNYLLMTYGGAGLFLSHPCHFLTLTANEFIAGRWHSGQLEPLAVTVTTQAGNVPAGRPTQLTAGGD